VSARAAGRVFVPVTLRDDPLWTGERFTRGQAWFDLWLHADTGVVVTTEAALAARWKWTRPTVRRFLDHLVTGGCLTLTMTAAGLQIRDPRPPLDADPVPARCDRCGGGLAAFEFRYTVWRAAEPRGWTAWTYCPPCLDQHRRRHAEIQTENVAVLDDWWRGSPE
jgi:hypothetical protein